MAKKKTDKLKKGYYKGGVARTVSFSEDIENRIYIFGSGWYYSYYDDEKKEQIEVTDEELCFKKWFETCMNSSYYDYNGELLNKLQFIDESIKFIEVE